MELIVYFIETRFNIPHEPAKVLAIDIKKHLAQPTVSRIALCADVPGRRRIERHTDIDEFPRHNVVNITEHNKRI
jgi:hypothetical protein